MAVYKNDKGLWSIRYKYKDNNGVWQQKMAYSGKSGFSRKKDAVEKEKEVIKEVQASLSQSQNNIPKTFKEVMDETLLECQLYMKETSIKTTQQALDHAKSIFDCPINEVTPVQLREIMLELVNKDLSVATMDKIYYKINLVFKYALENEYISVNPLTKVKRVKKPNEVNETKYNVWTFQEFQEYIQNVHEPIYYTLFSLLYYTGMRRGEALGLQWKDVNLENGTIYIKQTLSNVHSVKKAVLTPPKSSNSTRLIHIPHILLCMVVSKIAIKQHKYTTLHFLYIISF